MLALFLAGCAAPVALSTPSGRPEVSIHGASRDLVANRIVSDMETGGFTLKKDSTFSLVFGKPIEDTTARVLYGTRNSPNPEYRIQYTITEDAQAVRVIASLGIVSNPGTEHERISSMNGTKDAQDLQSALENLKSSLE